VLETARGGLLRAGMGYRSCNVGCVLNVTGDHLGIGGVDSLDQLAQVKRIVVEVARDVAVLNADDERCLLMSGHTEAKRIAYVTMNPRHDLVRQHIRAGGSAAVLEEGINGHMIALYDRGAHIPLLWAHLVPATLEAKAMFNVQNAMFAALMAFVMGQKVENIRQGLRTFDTTYFQAPGRLNVFDKLPFKVILDYGHNPAAVRAMTDLVGRLEVGGERVCVLSAPGDRREEDIVAIATVAAPAFDRFVLRTDDDARRKDRSDIPRLLARGLREGGVDDSRITVIEDEIQAIDAALASCHHGDLLVIFGDKISRCWKQITKFKSDGHPIATPAPEVVRAEPLETAPVPPRKLDWGGTLVEDERGVRVISEAVED
jgi:cyanophycin synthetase